jgi:hypothetical protein
MPDSHIHPLGVRSEEVENRLIKVLVIRVAHSSLEIVMTGADYDQCFPGGRRVDSLGQCIRRSKYGRVPNM